MKATFYDVLIAHAAMYPAMKPEDYVKLAFQSEFGCGHLLTDREAALSYLREEMSQLTADILEPLTVEIGGGFSRLNLRAAIRHLSPEMIFAMLERSAAPTGTKEGFDRKISLIRRSAKLGILPCDGEAVASYAASLGDHLPSHSALYKRLYGASYRVITTEMARLAPMIAMISEAYYKAGRLHIAIDGRAASGKSTAAQVIAELFDATLIHMDDYFLPASRRTPERLAVPGGNVDIERFLEEIAASLHSGYLTHARFDCQKQTLLPPVTEERKDIVIVEGVYALHPELRDLYDLKIFLDVDAETQRLRILARDGDAVWQRYQNDWIPLEEAYFSATDIRLDCDFISFI
ncbi:MAG: hypothetical protein E7618_01130 [Ruminococcaceae bacterium]|nr:hypothetical protein [Oscillospiraceae bacterium]